MSDTEAFLTLSEAAEFLKVSKSSLRRWSNCGDLACYRVGMRGERRFKLKDLTAFINKRTSIASPAQKTGSHICTNFKNSMEQWRLFKPFLSRHLNQDAAIVYLYSQKDSPIHQFLAENSDAINMLQEQRFLLLPTKDSYLKTGYFDLQRMLDFWQAHIDHFQQQGINRLLLTGEMDWATQGAQGCEQLITYEKTLDTFLQKTPNVTVVCQYNLNAFPASIIFDSVCLHPTVLPTAA